ncbi:MAG: hypothetical protein WCG04_02940 [Alphaproteobacteria bacterium]
MPRPQEGPRNDGESESLQPTQPTPVIASAAKQSRNVDIFKLFGYSIFLTYNCDECEEAIARMIPGP